MGTTQSAIETELGQSVMYKTYRINEPVCLGFKKSLNEFEMATTRNEFRPLNQTNPSKLLFTLNQGDFEITLPSGIVIQVIDVKKKWNFEMGTSAKIFIRLLSCPKLDPNTRVIETLYDKENKKTYWTDTTLDKSVDPTIDGMINKGGYKSIHIENNSIMLWNHEFFGPLTTNFDEPLYLKGNLEPVFNFY